MYCIHGSLLGWLYTQPQGRMIFWKNGVYSLVEFQRFVEYMLIWIEAVLEAWGWPITKKVSLSLHARIRTYACMLHQLDYAHTLGFCFIFCSRVYFVLSFSHSVPLMCLRTNQATCCENLGSVSGIIAIFKVIINLINTPDLK